MREWILVGALVALALVPQVLPSSPLVDVGPEPAPPPGGGGQGDAGESSGEAGPPRIHLTDKTAHALLYGALAGLVAWIMAAHGHRAAPIVVLVGYGTGLLAEGVQALLSYRDASAQDLAVDWSVTLLVAVVVLTLPRREAALGGPQARRPDATR